MKESKIFKCSDAYTLNDQVFAYAKEHGLVEEWRSAPAISNALGPMEMAVSVRFTTDNGNKNDEWSTFLAFTEAELEEQIFEYANAKGLVDEEWTAPAICNTDGYFRIAISVRFCKKVY